MIKYTLILVVLLISTFYTVCGTTIDSLVIQENTLGICTVDGVIENSQTGYTGEGYVNVDDGLSIGMSWSFNASSEGNYKVLWRFALGGGDATSRDAGLYVNNVLVDTIIFKHSDSQSWAEWKITDTVTVNIKPGLNAIRLSSITTKGLSNIDYFVIYGSGFTMSECVPVFNFSVKSNDTLFGTVSYNPAQQFFDAGTEITINASAKSGYFFHSWSGEESSTLENYAFNIKENTNLTALFYEDGTVTDQEATGYATIQHDNGTPYLLTGGNFGRTVEPGTIQELDAYMSSSEPLIINVSKHFVGEGEIKLSSNKTIIGTDESANIEGIFISVAEVRNVIFKNLTFSKVEGIDEMEINGGTNIWIDHCEFFTDRDHDKDYYDGLLDIKNASSFITVSWCNFHDHYKSILISSGDDSYQDSVQRITFHHNYFHDCNSRLPSIRFGRAHIFSNYYENNGGAINTRVGACVKVEHNYFKNTDGAIGKTGEAYLDMVPNTNIFDNSPYSQDIPPCKLSVPYPYDDLIDSASTLPGLIPDAVRIWVDNTGVEKLHSTDNSFNIQCYPNPVNDIATIAFRLSEPAEVSIDVYNILGKHVQLLVSKNRYNAGLHEIKCIIVELNPGFYILKLTIGNHCINKKIIIE